MREVRINNVLIGNISPFNKLSQIIDKLVQDPNYIKPNEIIDGYQDKRLIEIFKNI